MVLSQLAEATYEPHTEFWGNDISFEIAVSVGWDSSPRAVQSDMYENTWYPFCPIVDHNTPEEKRIFRK